MVPRLSYDNIANLAIAAAAVVVIGTHVRVWFGEHSTGTPAAAVSYAAGEVIPDWQVAMGASRPMVLVYVNSRCGYCTASMPFYARLATAMKDGRSPELLVASRESREVIHAYLARQSVSVTNVHTFPPSFAPHLKATPTVMLVAPDGRVVRVWRGVLSRDAEKEVMDIAVQLLAAAAAAR